MSTRPETVFFAAVKGVVGGGTARFRRNGRRAFR